MAQILQFRLPVRNTIVPASPEIDLLTAVDVALRDLADIIPHIGLPTMREQAEACRRLLQDAFDAECGE